MMKAVLGEDVSELISATEQTEELDLDVFDEDSVLEFGYCTELLVRLQNAKTDIPSFDVKVITDYLQTIGDSMAAAV